MPIEERIDAVAATGWQGIGFVSGDLRQASETIGLPALAARISEAGLRYTEVELAVDFWMPDPRSRESLDFLVHAAAELGARSIKAAGSMTERPTDDEMVGSLHALAEATSRTGAFLALEPFPFSNISTVPYGAELVAAADHPALGLVVDAWHVFRAGTSLDELRSCLRPEQIRVVELDDAADPTPPAEELFDDTADRRRLPGEGDFDLVGLVRLMREFGYHGPWRVEMISEEHRALPVVEALHAAAEATRTVLALARTSPVHNRAISPPRR